MNNKTKAVQASSAGTTGALSIKRLIFREVLAGDVKKFEAKSNKTKSGGGARDFRFRPYSEFDGIFERMLAGTDTKPRKRDGAAKTITIYTSPVSIWGGTVSHPLEFEPPTTARKNEGRLTRLNHLGLAVPKNQGRVFLVIHQTGDDKVWLSFATQDELTNKAWHPTINDFLLACMLAPRSSNSAAQGFLDIEAGTHFCNSKE